MCVCIHVHLYLCFMVSVYTLRNNSKTLMESVKNVCFFMTFQSSKRGSSSGTNFLRLKES